MEGVSLAAIVKVPNWFCKQFISTYANMCLGMYCMSCVVSELIIWSRCSVQLLYTQIVVFGSDLCCFGNCFVSN